MADRNTVDFFLSGVNESVALEIPLNTNHREYIPEIKKALQDAGIQVGGVENGGVEVTDNAYYNTTPIGILTPVLHPSDLNALYDLIYAVLDPIGIRPQYPYVRDLNHLPKKKLSSGVDISDVAEEMIETAIASGIATGEYKAMKANGFSYHNFVQHLKQTGHLFAGSTISDPYTVASDFVSRDTRMASTDVQYAITFASGMKQQSGHEQRAKRGFRFGFLYEYERAPNQPMFGNTGIENGGDAGVVGSNNETPVNRFTNPCVGRWFVWFDEKSQIYNVYKIPENDEHWERMLASLETVMHSGVPQYNWIDKLDKSDKQPVSVVNGVRAGQLQQYVDDIKQQNAQRAKDKEQLVAEINKEIDDIKKEIDKLNKKIAEYIQLDNSKTINASGNYQQRKQAKDELSRKLAQMQTVQAEIQSVFDAIQSRYDALVQRAGDIEQTKMTLLNSTVTNARNQVNKCATRVDSITKNLGDIDKNITAFIKNNYAELSSDDIRSLSPEQRKTIFESVSQDMIMSNDALRAAIKIYMCASTLERSEYFAEFDKYVARNPKKYTEKLKRVLEGVPNVPDEIKELSRGKSLFVNHIERARKKMLLLQAQQHVEDKQNTEQINVAVEIEKE